MKAEGRGQKAEVRRQKSEGRRQNIETLQNHDNSTDRTNEGEFMRTMPFRLHRTARVASRCGLFLLPFTFCLLPFLAAGDDLKSSLQLGLFEEEANRNLPAAISAYQAVLTQFDKDRELAATAVFRLGECYRKLEKTNEAVGCYRRIVREFPDSGTLAKLSQQNLAALGAAPSGTNQLQAKLAAIVSEEEAEIQRLKTLLKDSPDLFNAPSGGLMLTPLQSAAAKGYANVVRFLLANGADVNLAGANGWTPLQYAADAGHKAVVEALLTAKAEVTPPSGKDSPLHYAAKRGFVQLTELLIANKADVNHKGASGATPLHGAISSGNRAIVELLISKGADVTAKDDRGSTALHLAAARADLPLVELLLNCKAEVNATDSSDETPLGFAVRKGEKSVVELLLKHGADVNAGYAARGSLLHEVISNIRADTLKLLLGRKPDLAKRDVRGFTVLQTLLLHVVRGSNREAPEKVQMLVQAGADPNEPFNPAISDEGQMYVPTIPGAAIGGQQHVRLSGFTPLELACVAKQVSTAKALLDTGAKVKTMSPDGSTPLHYAVSARSLPFVQAVLAHSPDTELRDRERATPLMRAVEAGEVNICEALLKAGANPNATNFQNGMTPLFQAAGSANKALVQLLLEYKADVNHVDKEGSTILALIKPGADRSSAANAETYREIVALLLKHGARDAPSEPAPNAQVIRVWRAGWPDGDVVFRKDTNGLNYFTLIEALVAYYNYYNGPPHMYEPVLNFSPAIGRLPSPDLSKLRVRRLTGGTNTQPISVNLMVSPTDFDCARDIGLDFGDVVEIPARANAAGSGLPAGQRDQLWRRCAPCKVTLTVRGASSYLADTPPGDGRYLSRALAAHATLPGLPTSSDLSRVKVTRRDPKTGEAKTFTRDVLAFRKSGQPISEDLALRDGDVIEVPERE